VVGEEQLDQFRLSSTTGANDRDDHTPGSVFRYVEWTTAVNAVG
jgi:hypothetical protein